MPTRHCPVTTFHTAMKAPMVLSALLSASLIASAASGQITGLGAMGDSLTDEYADRAYNYASNWIEQLTMYRGLNVGPTAAEAGQPGGTWGDGRGAGHEYNWALFGTRTAGLLSQGQHTGVAGLVGPDGVSHAVLCIGANDFFPISIPNQAYYEIYSGNWSQAQIDTYVNQMLANIEMAITTVSDTGAGLVVATVPDFGLLPSVWSAPNWSDLEGRNRVTAVLRQVDRGIANLAEKHEIMLADLSGLLRAMFGPNDDLHEFLILGDVTIELWEKDTTRNSLPQAAFVHDGIHPHTNIQGMMANLFAAALNGGYGVGLTLFSEAEILDHTGMPYGGTDTLEPQVGLYTDYVWNFLGPHPYEDLNADGTVDLLDVARLQTCFMPVSDALTPGCGVADLNDDGAVDLIDSAGILAVLGGP